MDNSKKKRREKAASLWGTPNKNGEWSCAIKKGK